jgi:hypothetical protein
VPDDPRALDALLEDRGGGWWSAFFADRAGDSADPCPFLVDWPDESLVSWFSQGLLTWSTTPAASTICRRTAARTTWTWWTGPRVRELRQMRETDGKDTCFGQGFLWVLLVSKRR